MTPFPLPTDPEGREALAGEYVLGTLDARAAAAVRAALPGDAALAEAVAAWEERLSPLVAAVPQAAPPPDLWDRIEAGMQPASAATSPAAALGHAAQAAHETADRLRRMLALWRAWALGATAATAALAAVTVVQTDRTRQLEASLRAQPAALPGAPVPGMLAVQPPAPPPPGAPPASQFAQPSPPPAPGQPQVLQATSSQQGAAVVKPAAADAAPAQPTHAPPQGAPIQAVPMQHAPGAVVSGPSPASGGAMGVRPASGSEDLGVIRR